MIVDRAYSGATPESHILVEVTPTTLRELAARLEERAKSSQKDKVLTLRLTREITLAYQVEDNNYGFQIGAAAEKVRGISETGEDESGHFR